MDHSLDVVRIVRPRLVVAAVVVVALVTGALAFSYLTAPRSRWTSPDAHVVDGVWIEAERPCPLDGSDSCRLELAAARAGVEIEAPGATIVEAIVTKPALGHYGPNGEQYLTITSGWVEGAIVIVRLDDGRRHMIALACEPDMAGADGRATPAVCHYAGPATPTRVGEEPWLATPGTGA